MGSVPCKEFSDYPMLYDYYSNFLSYDMTMAAWNMGAPKPAGYYAGPEVMFYFSIRDSGNFGESEHFGLLENCQSTDCKMSKSRVGNAVNNELDESNVPMFM